MENDGYTRGGMLQGVVVAAGLSRRMQAFKPLLLIDGRTMVERSIHSMLCAGVRRVVVVLGYRGAEIEEVLRRSGFLERIHIVYNHDYAATQMLDSIKIGVGALDDCRDFFLLPGDMPAVDPQTFRAVYNAHRNGRKAVTFPTIDGYRKHPPLISAACIPAILSFQEDGGLRQLWRTMENDIQTVPVDDLGCTIDVDYPRDYTRVLQYVGDRDTAHMAV